MAKVFTPEEVQDYRIPEVQNFSNAARWLLEAVMNNPATGEHTAGALVFGSTTNGSSNIRSDLDLFISHTSHDQPSTLIASYQKIFKFVETQWNVPVEPVVFSAARLQSGIHTIDPIFARHIVSVDSQKWVTGIHPATDITFKDQNWTDIFTRYALHKESKFKKALLSANNEIDFKVLQRAYELPSALGRKALAVLVLNKQVDDSEFHIAPKAAVIEAISQLFGSKVVEPLTELVERDKEYSALLHATVGRGYDKVRLYDTWLGEQYQPTLEAANNFATDLLDSMS
jgi:predicted nucleotidyltransferase